MSSKRRPRRGAALAALLAGVLTSGLGGFPALVAGAAAAAAAPACHPGYDGLPGEAEHPYACRYLDATMPDGTTIAVVVSLPVGFRADRPYPALFMMDGYDGGGGALDPNSYGNRFVMVHASIRGTGCSGGQFDLFSWHDAEDGADLVEHWIPGQSWSDGRVGIIGHSYPGLTGFMVAERVGYDHALQPSSTEHLTGVAVSGLIDDVYRGITYMGGIPDFGFPLAWDGALRPAQEDVGNFDRYRAEAEAGDTGCVHALVTRQESDVLDPSLVADDPIVNGVLEQQDGPWWVVHSLITYAGYLDVPIHVDQQYQDEQTGPRGGAVLFEALEHLKPTLPMRIVLGNGRHDSAGHVYHADEQAWLDCFVAKLAGDCRRLGAE
jgi:putative CocE/NonD family hydrolase